MLRDSLGELAVAAVLAVLLLLLVNPWKLWMPNTVVMALLAVFVALFALFAATVWRERPRDERERVHRLGAGRLAFLAGAVVAAAGVTVQSFQHALDPWLALTLGAMIAAKGVGLMYQRSRH